MPEAKSPESAVTEAAVRVFETSAFMTIAPLWPQDDQCVPCDCGATMTFDGAHRGRISMKISRQILLQLVENMIGLSDDDGYATARGDDAMCETLNMICGNILTEWYGQEATYDLHPPRALTLDEIDALHDGSSVTVALNLEQTHFMILAELSA